MARTISTNTSTGITLTSGDNPVSVTGTIESANGSAALYGPGGASQTWTINNSGSISANSMFPGGQGVRLGSHYTTVASGSVTNKSGGVISAAGDYALAVYGPGSVTNLSGGTIRGTMGFGPGIGSAVLMAEAAGTVVNNGQINAAGYGINERAGGSVINNAGGTIVGSGVGVLIRGAAGTVTNARHDQRLRLRDPILFEQRQQPGDC